MCVNCPCTLPELAKNLKCTILLQVFHFPEGGTCPRTPLKGLKHSPSLIGCKNYSRVHLKTLANWNPGYGLVFCWHLPLLVYGKYFVILLGVMVLHLISQKLNWSSFVAWYFHWKLPLTIICDQRLPLQEEADRLGHIASNFQSVWWKR